MRPRGPRARAHRGCWRYGPVRPHKVAGRRRFIRARPRPRRRRVEARRPRRAADAVAALLAKDAASLEERGPGLSPRAGSVLLGVALCDQSLRQRAALQRCTEAGFLERALGALVVACASFLPDDAMKLGLRDARRFCPGRRASTTAPASRKTPGRGPFFGKSPRINRAPRRRRRSEMMMSPRRGPHH